MDKLSMKSVDVTQTNMDRIAELFPSVITEIVAPNGDRERGVDFDLLRQELSSAVVEGSHERYQMDWPGKRAAAFAANAPIAKTLRPVRAESVNFDTASHLFIEGDNLDALKLLREPYLGAVKLIYIDPPYNTHGNMLYPDTFALTTAEYLEVSAQASPDGTRLVANPESNGRFHSDWLSMIYPRLKLARSLLTSDGAIAISIDDNELARLLQVGSEIFGSDNLINVVAVKSSEASGVKMSHVDRRLPKLKEYVVIFARDKAQLRLTPIRIEKGELASSDLDSYLKYYAQVIVDPSAPVEQWEIRRIIDVLKEEGIAPTADAVRAYKLANAERTVYRTNNNALAALEFPTATARVVSATGLEYVWWEGKQMLFLGDYLRETLGDLWTDISTINLNKETLGVDGFGQGQKPLALVTRLLDLFTTDATDAIILDFFVGSGTTAHAVMQKNTEDGGTRRVIAVQFPEHLDPAKKEHRRAIETCDALGAPRTIAELSKERIRRAADQAGAGLRVFRIDTTNRADVRAAPDDLVQTALADAARSIKTDRTDEDLLVQVLLEWGLDLTAPVVREEVAGGTVYEVDGGALLACFVDDLTDDIVRQIALREPLRAVFKDAAFADDAARVNAEQVFLQLAPAADVKVL
jgi:adenine-specific DNA-methyltransferase